MSAHAHEYPRAYPLTIRLLALGFIMLVFFVMQWLTDVLAVYPYLDLSPDLAYHGSWVQLSDHHLWQLLLATLLIVCFAGKHWPTWGLNLTNLSQSLQIVWQFGLVFSLYLIILQLLAHRAGEIPTLNYPLTATNILGWLSFQLLLSGPSEEIVFRGLIQSYLRQFWSTVWHWGTLSIPVAGLITAVIFGLAHINFTLVPLTITHFDLLQVSGAFFFGLCYALFYQRTGSLVAPMLLHSLGNVVTLGMVYLRVIAL